MRKIETKAEKEKREKRRNIVFGTILVVIMIFSTLGYSFFQNEATTENKKVNYNGLSFIMGDDGFWHTSISGNDFSFRFLPAETENISIEINLNLQNYTNKPLYFDAEDLEAESEIARNVFNFAERMQDACFEEKNCKNEFPVKNCSTDNIIIIREANYTQISQKKNCVFINMKKGRLNENIRASDAFVYRIFGITF